MLYGNKPVIPKVDFRSMKKIGTYAGLIRNERIQWREGFKRELGKCRLIYFSVSFWTTLLVYCVSTLNSLFLISRTILSVLILSVNGSIIQLVAQYRSLGVLNSSLSFSISHPLSHQVKSFSFLKRSFFWILFISSQYFVRAMIISSGLSQISL